MITVSIAFIVMALGLFMYHKCVTPKWSETGKYMFGVGLFWVLANMGVIQTWFQGLGIQRH